MVQQMQNEEQVGHTALDEPISLEEVQQGVKRAKLHKATGPDQIPSEALKNNACIPVLHNLINQAFKHGIVPSAWNQAIIVPFPKGSSKDPRVPLNYRGISLLNTTCKIYSDILNKRLVAFLEENELLANEQNGFRTKRSCLDHIYTLDRIIQNRKSSRLSTYVCFIDATKAFDSVNRDCLWFKMLQIGISGKFLAAIKSLYKDIQCAVRVNGILSDYFSVNNGVKQGCVLSPTLFSIYVDDLVNNVKQCECGVKVMDDEISILLFADDIAIIAPTEEKLQRLLNCVTQ
jgi:hypothetical protein